MITTDKNAVKNYWFHSASIGAAVVEDTVEEFDGAIIWRGNGSYKLALPERSADALRNWYSWELMPAK